MENIWSNCEYKPNNIYNVDCYEAIKKMPDKSIDLIVTSPPYDNLRTYNGEINQWNFEKFKKIAYELYRIIKKGGVIVWIVRDQTITGSETGTSFKQALYFMQCGFNLHDTMIWYKENCPFPDKTRYYQSFEYMFIFSKGKPKTFNAIFDKKNKCVGDVVHGSSRQINGNLLIPSGQKSGRKIKKYGCRYNVWNICPVLSNKERTKHPAQFPIKLIIDHITSWSKENDVVLDCFLGSGTTAVACKETNRQYIGFEIDEKYFNIAKDRLNGTTQQERKIKDKGQLSIFDFMEN